MSREPVVISVVRLEVSERPTMKSAKISMHGDRGDVATLNFTPGKLLELAVLIEQLELDIETARWIANVRSSASVGSSRTRDAAIVTVHVARNLSALQTGDGGVLLDVEDLRGENFRLAISAEQAAAIFFRMYPGHRVTAQ
jgi:hypothetical protein